MVDGLHPKFERAGYTKLSHFRVGKLVITGHDFCMGKSHALRFDGTD